MTNIIHSLINNKFFLSFLCTIIILGAIYLFLTKKCEDFRAYKNFILIFIFIPLFSLLLSIYEVEKLNLGIWLGFFGAYSGVGGTVGAVWWQLNKQRKEKEKEEKEKEKEEKYNKKLKEGYAVVTFLILFRETAENLFYYYQTLFDNKDKIKKEELKNINSLINYELFNSCILEMDITLRNRCIELFYLFSIFSSENKVFSSSINNYESFLVSYYYNIFKKTDEILTEYENIRKEKEDYVEIISEKLFSDVTSLLEYTNDFSDKYRKK